MTRHPHTFAASEAEASQQQLDQTRANVTGHARTEQTGHARERSRKIREREKSAQKKFDEYFAVHGDRLRREEEGRRQKNKHHER